MTGTPSSDLAALLSAADAQGNIDPAQLQAQRLLQANRILGGYDANGLVAGVLATSDLHGTDQCRLIDAISRQLPQADRARFEQALDAANVGANPLRQAVEPPPLPSAPANGSFKRLSEADQGLCDTWTRWLQDLRGQVATPDANIPAAPVDHLVDGAQQQFQPGSTRDLIKHAANQADSVIDLAKLGRQIHHSPGFAKMLAGTIIMYSTQALRDPNKPPGDPNKLGAQLGMEWGQGMLKAESEDRMSEYIDQASGTIAMEALLAVVPLEKIVTLARTAGLTTREQDKAATGARPGLGPQAGHSLSADAEQALSETLDSYMRAMQAAQDPTST